MSTLTVVTVKFRAAPRGEQSPRADEFLGGENRHAGYVSFRMKYLSTLAILAVLICGLSGCASTDTTAKGDPVPGETKSMEESRMQPGGAPGSATMKW